MLRSCSCFALHLALLFSLITFGCSPSHAQQPEKADIPQAPQGPVEQNLRVSSAQASYRMISGKERIQWAALETFGPESLFIGTLAAGIGTGRDRPQEYGPHWDGFAKRYGIRFTGVAASATIEAGLGAIWGEDPRYVRNQNLPFKHRLGNVFLFSFAARDRRGKVMPAYARYIAIPGNNFLSNTWRVSSEANTSSALTRTAYGVLAEVSSNAWNEFWPDVRRKVFKK
ncbi:MAG TPA: hypothetical protein VM781_01670 [Candidatus Bathyarchaeia archaeon]|nr:hypothetical protein [Candidatus Bathyarchaeia archaeon]